MSVTPHSTTHRPLTTSHAATRLAERFPETGDSARTLWTKGVTAELPDKDFDGTRYYPPAEIVVCRDGNAIVTVLDAAPTRVRTPGAVRCSACGEPHEAVPMTECPWCGEMPDKQTTGTITVRYTGGE